ncbi:MAG: exodeoxyribonuclease VII small subunit [Alphaproteobacteria bacterium]|nr:exodeoxyribonuclease VII small subunit [Alphaproteobacteria bacterium]MDP6564113.1 exodeoxyribonuclease VII small subunit [Alphaproteobacteria bacterium]MDP6814748.1 exodeoxyribonuclease VII small subunit [Alphaproteobacteria bacterium]
MAKKTAADEGAIPEDIAALSFEAAMAELEEIVQRLEGGQVDLEASIEMYSRGALLKRHCEGKLRTASEKVEKIVADASGQATGVEPADIE